MHPIDSSSHNRSSIQFKLALSLCIFLVCATIPYSWLIEYFGYDDILREPSAVILYRFNEGGGALIFAWFAFAVSALLFIPVTLSFKHLFSSYEAPGLGAEILGIASAVVQTIGLLRWVLVVPGLAITYLDPLSTEATRDASIVVFDAVHRYGGMIVGEMVGQLLLAGWTVLVVIQLWRTRAVPRGLSLVGALTLPFWLLGQTELLHAVVPSVRSLEVIPLAFMLWEAWLGAMAVSLLVRAKKSAR